MLGRAPGAELGPRHHPGPGHHEIRHGIPRHHGIKKVEHLNFRRPVQRRPALVASLPGRPEHNASRPSALREPPRGGLVDRVGSLAPTGHQHDVAPCRDAELREGGSTERRIGRRDRIAGIEHHRSRAGGEPRPGLGKAEVDVANPAGEEAGGESGEGVLFLDGSGNAAPRGQPDHRCRGIARRSPGRRGAAPAQAARRSGAEAVRRGRASGRSSTTGGGRSVRREAGGTGSRGSAGAGPRCPARRRPAPARYQGPAAAAPPRSPAPA